MIVTRRFVCSISRAVSRSSSGSPAVALRSWRASNTVQPWTMTRPAPRWFVTSFIGDDELRKLKNEFQDKFVEARMCVADCEDSAGSVYFNEDAEDAKAALEDCLETYKRIMEALNEEQGKAFQRENGLKVEQLKVELQNLLNADH